MALVPIEEVTKRQDVRLRHTVTLDGDSGTWLHLTTLGAGSGYPALYVASKTDSSDCTLKDCGAKHKYALTRYICETHCDRPDLFSRNALAKDYQRIA